MFGFRADSTTPGSWDREEKKGNSSVSEMLWALADAREFAVRDNSPEWPAGQARLSAK